MMPLTESDKADILSRLARSEVVSLRHATNQDQYALELAEGYIRFIKNFPPAFLTAEEGKKKMDTYLSMLALLNNSHLTVNIKAPKWFYDENKYTSYTNCFEGRESGASPDMKKRDETENIFGRYQGGAHVAALSNQPNSPFKNAQSAQQRIETFGVRTAPDFHGSVRPRYAAVDFAKCKEGASSKYGKSFLVLKEHMKHNATYLHKDSFEVNSDLIARAQEYGGKVKTLNDVTATYFELGKILLYCDPVMLKNIHQYATGEKVVGSEQNIMQGLNYIEAHLHTDLIFKRDVDTLVISRSEMQAGVIPHPRFFSNWPTKKISWDASDAQRVEKYANKFKDDNNIKIEFI
jgi:hypothetical protein